MMYPKKLPPPFIGVDLSAEGYVTVQVACEYLSVSKSTLHRWMDGGGLPFAIIDGFKGRRIPRVGIRIFMEKS